MFVTWGIKLVDMNKKSFVYAAIYAAEKQLPVLVHFKLVEACGRGLFKSGPKSRK